MFIVDNSGAWQRAKDRAAAEQPAFETTARGSYSFKGSGGNRVYQIKDERRHAPGLVENLSDPLPLISSRFKPHLPQKFARSWDITPQVGQYTRHLS